MRGVIPVGGRGCQCNVAQWTGWRRSACDDDGAMADDGESTAITSSRRTARCSRRAIRTGFRRTQASGAIPALRLPAPSQSPPGKMRTCSADSPIVRVRDPSRPFQTANVSVSAAVCHARRPACCVPRRPRHAHSAAVGGRSVINHQPPDFVRTGAHARVESCRLSGMPAGGIARDPVADDLSQQSVENRQCKVHGWVP